MATYTWSLTFRDVGGNDATVQGYLNAVDETAAEAALQGIAEALNNPAPAGVGALPLTLGKIVDARLSRSINLPGSGWTIRGAAVAGAENQKGGRFVFTSNGGANTSKLTVPTFNEALKLNTGYIDIANPAVFAFFDTAYIANGGADNRWDDLTALKDAYFTYGGKPAFK